MAQSSEKAVNWGRAGVIAVPYLWLIFFFLAPLFIVLKLSFSDPDVAIPPYTPQFSFADGWQG